MSGRARKLAAPLLIAAALVAIYYQVAADLVRAWITDGNYSHGFLIIPLAAYFAWERRFAFNNAERRPSPWGIGILAASLLVLLAGLLGSEYFLSRISIIGVLGGLIVAAHGWRRLRVLMFPLAFLLLMIPLPAIIFNQIALPLQFVASRAGEMVIDAFGIPVLREGNVLVLANTTLEVAEACSGIRSLVSLITLGLVFGYFTDARFWTRALLVAITVPVAIVANAARVAGTGLLASWKGPDAAQGFFHEFSGWIVFLVAFALILGAQQFIARLAPAREKRPRVRRPVTSSEPSGVPVSPGTSVSIVACLVVGAVLVMRTNTRDTAPARSTFGSFPMRIGAWQGFPDAPFTPDVLAVLGATDYLTRDYVSPERRAVGLYIGYWQSQRQGETIHSPLNCLPGSGWEPVSRTTIAVNTSPGDAPLVVNRYLVVKGLDRQLVYYWYQSHGRVTASEYMSRLYLMADAVRLHRTDGAIVRVIAPVQGDGADAEPRAEQLATRFMTDLVPHLTGFLPN